MWPRRHMHLVPITSNRICPAPVDIPKRLVVGLGLLNISGYLKQKRNGVSNLNWPLERSVIWSSFIQKYLRSHKIFFNYSWLSKHRPSLLRIHRTYLMPPYVKILPWLGSSFIPQALIIFTNCWNTIFCEVCHWNHLRYTTYPSSTSPSNPFHNSSLFLAKGAHIYTIKFARPPDFYLKKRLTFIKFFQNK